MYRIKLTWLVYVTLWYCANGSIHRYIPNFLLGGDRLDEISPTVERYTFSSLSVNITRLGRDLNCSVLYSVYHIQCEKNLYCPVAQWFEVCLVLYCVVYRFELLPAELPW